MYSNDPIIEQIILYSFTQFNLTENAFGVEALSIFLIKDFSVLYYIILNIIISLNICWGDCCLWLMRSSLPSVFINLQIKICIKA